MEKLLVKDVVKVLSRYQLVMTKFYPKQRDEFINLYPEELEKEIVSIRTLSNGGMSCIEFTTKND